MPPFSGLLRALLGLAAVVSAGASEPRAEPLHRQEVMIGREDTYWTLLPGWVAGSAHLWRERPNGWMEEPLGRGHFRALARVGEGVLAGRDRDLARWDPDTGGWSIDPLPPGSDGPIWKVAGDGERVVVATEQAVWEMAGDGPWERVLHNPAASRFWVGRWREELLAYDKEQGRWLSRAADGWHEKEWLALPPRAAPCALLPLGPDGALAVTYFHGLWRWDGHTTTAFAPDLMAGLTEPTLFDAVEVPALVGEGTWLAVRSYRDGLWVLDPEGAVRRHWPDLPAGNALAWSPEEQALWCLGHKTHSRLSWRAGQWRWPEETFSGQRLLSVAPQGEEVWVSTTEALWRRRAEGPWERVQEGRHTCLVRWRGRLWVNGFGKITDGRESLALPFGSEPAQLVAGPGGELWASDLAGRWFGRGDDDWRPVSPAEVSRFWREEEWLASRPLGPILARARDGPRVWVAAELPEGGWWLGAWEEGRWRQARAWPDRPPAVELAPEADGLWVVAGQELWRLPRWDDLREDQILAEVRLRSGGHVLADGPVELSPDAPELRWEGRLGPREFGRWWRWAYRLDGGPWQPAAAEGSVLLGRWGRFRLELRAEETASGLTRIFPLTGRVVRPWWASWGMLGAYLALAAGAVVLLWRWRTARLRERARQLERLVEKKAGQLQKALQARGEFLASMSHEIKNPLHGLTGFVERLGQIPLPPEAAALYQDLQLCADYLRGTVEDILDWSRIEAGKLTLRPQPVRWTMLKARVEAVYQHQARAKGLEFRWEDQVPTERWYQVDAARLEQVLGNLVGNAVRYTVRGAVTIRSGEALLEDGHEARLLVFMEDTGPGISAEDRERLFQRYERGAQAAGPGTGLGLAISHALVSRMGGALRLASEPGRGSIFTVELTLLLAKARATTVGIRPPAGLRVLVVEDQAPNRKLVQLWLEEAGARCQCLESATAAWELYRLDSAWDCLLTDWDLPGSLTGFDLARRVREAHPGQAVVLMTAYGTPEFLEKAAAQGVSLLAKPFGREDLWTALHLAAPARSANPAASLWGQARPEARRLAAELVRELHAGHAEAVRETAHALLSYLMFKPDEGVQARLREIQEAARAGHHLPPLAENWGAVEAWLREHPAEAPGSGARPVA